jgi:ABC-type bacteriocin/lantibiotic exporter with double-glycine peptidase domain
MRTLEPVKEFWTYTLLRIALFLGSAAIIYGIWAVVSDEVPVVWVVVIGFVISGLGSYVLLNPQREAFARRVDERARRATAKIEELRSKEDAD